MIKYLRDNNESSEIKGIFSSHVEHGGDVCVQVIPRDDGCSMSYDFEIESKHGNPYTIDTDIIGGSIVGIDDMDNNICDFSIKINPIFTTNGSHEADSSTLKYIIAGLNLINKDFMTFVKHVRNQRDRQLI